ncbi:MAG: hypothetical protein JNM70_06520 [Anaerolineae bacterium]|nr:hypothetical protein [Anaerolineae bacterium]
MGRTSFEAVMAEALELSAQEQMRLIERLAAALQEQPTAEAQVESSLLTDEELDRLLQVEPLSGTEIVASGLTGTWADLGITDGAE